jgi:four helix bundle protein
VGQIVKNYKELDVYQNAINSAMDIFQLTKSFPSEEKYSLVDQVRRCSRSVCANVAEAWRKRRYQAAFVAKLSDAEAEASETQVWIELAQRCTYIDKAKADEIDTKYDHIVRQLVCMINESNRWLIK